jgi:hypothetical protein
MNWYWLFLVYGFLWWRFWPTMAETDPAEKAMSLFLSWLTRHQRQDYLRNNYFDVIGSHTKRVYRINKAVAPFNVQCMDDPTMRLCFVPQNANLPGDIMLAQKIGLETNEEHVLKIANDYNRWNYGNAEVPPGPEWNHPLHSP